MKWRRDSQAGEPAQASQPHGAGDAGHACRQARQPTHRAVTTIRIGDSDLEMEIGAAWTFNAQTATGLTVLLSELPPSGVFTLIEINPQPGTYDPVESGTPAGTMPHLRAAVRNATTGRYDFIGDAWRLLAKDNSAQIHVRLKPANKALRFALFNRAVWKP